MDYVDANILIYALDDAGEKGKASRALLSQVRLATSMLSLDEVAYKFSRISGADAAKAVDLLSTVANLELIPFLPPDLSRFRALLSKGFFPRDSIHLLTAEKSGCRSIYSEDRDFDRQRAIRRKVPWKK